MKRVVSLLIATAVAAATLALAAPAQAWDSGNANGTEPVLSGDNLTMCAIRETASIYCWGSNSSGQLGRGTGNAATLTVATVLSPASKPARSISVNSSTACAVLLNRTVACWGANTDGRVGNGSTGAYVDTPTVIPSFTNVANVSVGTPPPLGAGAACAVKQDGTVWCWGNPSWAGFTGFPSGVHASPVKVAGITNAVDVSVGLSNVCAVLITKRIVCWGANNIGQLGDGGNAAHTGLRTVTGITDAVAVGLGSDNACALRVGGKISCWGDNTYGSLGANSTVSYSPVPLAVYGVTGATSFAMSPFGGCATISGIAKCWGSNDLGRIGDGQFVTATAPAKATAGLALPKATSVWSSYWGSCEIADAGRVWCWGNGAGGRLGNGTTTNYDAGVGTGPGNSFGYAADPTRVTLLNSAPGKPTGSSTAVHKIKITWAAPSTSGGAAAPKDYLVQWRLKGSSTWHTFSHTATTSRSATVTGLSAGKYYQFRVYAKNWAGTGSVSSVSNYIKSR